MQFDTSEFWTEREKQDNKRCSTLEYTKLQPIPTGSRKCIENITIQIILHREMRIHWTCKNLKLVQYLPDETPDKHLICFILQE